MLQFIRKSLELTPEQWQALERLAAELNTTPPRGPTAGQPSWRSLIKSIADHQLTVTPKEQTQ